MEGTSTDHGNSIRKYLKEGNVDQAKRLLNNLCAIIKEKEKENCVECYPAYKLDNPSEPVIALLQRETTPSHTDIFLGVDVYKRRYDDVSQEAAKVMNSSAVRENLFSVEEVERIHKAIIAANLTEEHSNITLISSCPFRSTKGGNLLKKEPCIVIHCLLKGLIPFGEKAFPRSVGGIAVDVREGYCEFGMMFPSPNTPADGDVEMPDDKSNKTQGRPQFPPKGPISRIYNEKLLIGTGIGPSRGPRRGTLGGFVRTRNGSMRFLTCAHVVHGVGTKVSQPADDDIAYGNWPSFECGEVIRRLFDPGSLDSVGVDAALVKITDHSRAPIDGSFISVETSQLLFAGFDPSNPPKFSEGKILKIGQITNNMKRMSVLKFGSETGLTIGLVHQNGTYGRQVSRLLKLPTGTDVEFFNQFEILSIEGTSKRFFELGDSGSLVFLVLDDKDLYCLGFAVGCTNYGSCLVTPIECVLDKLQVKFVDFTKPQMRIR